MRENYNSLILISEQVAFVHHVVSMKLSKLKLLHFSLNALHSLFISCQDEDSAVSSSNNGDREPPSLGREALALESRREEEVQRLVTMAIERSNRPGGTGLKEREGQAGQFGINFSLAFVEPFMHLSIKSRLGIHALFSLSVSS